jgi:electron transport complex protein RnfG
MVDADEKKIASTFSNMVIVLTLIALASALALGFTFSATKKARHEAKIKKTLKAIKDVLPGFDNNPHNEKYTLEGHKDMEFYPAKKDGQPVGTAVKTYSDEGFSERIWLMVGFDKDGKIHNLTVLKHKETPGLGTKMNEPKFIDQFKGRNPALFKLRVVQDEGDVDAITAATVSSRAFCIAVERAYLALRKGGKK